jgi:peptidoglycan/LPS O-acetylase OafA/YrhL
MMGVQDNSRADRFDNIDGIRTYAALGIIAMHVLVNGSYSLEGFLFSQLIPSFADFVFLFMMVSSFSMCCGYYERILQCKITPTTFYRKRYAKIWPFFTLLTVLDIVISPGKDALIEAFANLTLCFGLLPNANISVIGVGWTLGVIFAFYLLFPFFCFLISTKKQSWIVFGIAVLWNYVCSNYFFDQMHVAETFAHRTNILYTAVYFVAGGMIYLYRGEIQRIFGKRLCWIFLLLFIVFGATYLLLDKNVLLTTLMYGSLLIFVVSRGSRRGLLNNRFTKFMSGISMEIYLSHMVIYRIIEKLNWLNLVPSQLLSFFTVFLMTVVGSVLFSTCINWGIGTVSRFLQNIKECEFA